MWATSKRFPHISRLSRFFVIGISSFAISCHPPPDEKYDQTLRINLTSRLTSLDPAQATSQSNIWMVSQVYEGLVGLDSSLQVVPLLAKCWEIEENGRAYRFHLRTDAMFHSDSCFQHLSRNLIAQDVQYSFERLLAPDSKSSAQAYFAPQIAGADSFRQGLTERISGIQAINDSTILFHLKNPFRPFLSLLALPTASIVAKEAVDTYGSEMGRHAVGTGPYRFSYWTEERRLVLLRNNAYRESVAEAPAAVEVRFIRDPLNAYSELKLGNLDFIEGIDPALLAELNMWEKMGSESPIHVYRGPQLTTEYLGFRQDSLTDPWNKPELRRALSLLIDRNVLTEKVLQGLASPGKYGIVPPGMPNWPLDSLPISRYEPAEAEKILAGLGHPKGKGLPKLVLLTNAVHLNTAQFLQFAWQKAGIAVEIEIIEGAALRDRVYKGQAQLWRASWIADYADPENYFSLFDSNQKAPNGPNTTRFSDAEYDRIYGQSLREIDAKKVQGMNQQLAVLLNERMPVIVLYYYRTLRCTSARVKSFPNSPMNLWLPLHLVRLKE